jgi:hypothetical protein
MTIWPHHRMDTPGRALFSASRTTPNQQRARAWTALPYPQVGLDARRAVQLSFH